MSEHIAGGNNGRALVLMGAEPADALATAASTRVIDRCDRLAAPRLKQLARIKTDSDDEQGIMAGGARRRQAVARQGSSLDLHAKPRIQG